MICEKIQQQKNEKATVVISKALDALKKGLTATKNEAEALKTIIALEKEADLLKPILSPVVSKKGNNKSLKINNLMFEFPSTLQPPTIRPSTINRELYLVYPEYKVNNFLTIKKKFYYNGASIPSFAWQLVGTPFEPSLTRAGVIHDWLYSSASKGKTEAFRNKADHMFYELLVDSKIHWFRAWVIYEAVDIAGKIPFKKAKRKLTSTNFSKEEIK